MRDTRAEDWVQAPAAPRSLLARASVLRYLQAKMNPLAVVPLFIVTALCEIAGCYLVFLWIRGERSSLFLVGAAIALGLFAWLLSFHPNAGRAYAAYGGVYVAAAVVWGWLIEKQTPDRWDILGATISLIGMAVIIFGPRN